MEISDIKIRKTMHEGRLRALVSITIDNAIAVHEIKIVQGDTLSRPLRAKASRNAFCKPTATTFSERSFQAAAWS